jgi:predicted aconitase
MQLTREEEKATSGEHGEATAMAYRILVAIGEATGAEKLIPIKWAHVSGVNYNTIGDSGLEFLNKISKEGKVRVRTSINPMGFDRRNPSDLPQNFVEKQFDINKSYEKLGVIPTFSCIPYELLPIPEKGSQVSFAESSAAVMANSHLGILTNKESALSALASAIVGKTPLSDLRIEGNRNPSTEVISEVSIENELDYGLLGYFTGKTIGKSCTGICNITKGIDIWKLKSVSAGIGTSGSCGMFKIQEQGVKNHKSEKIEKVTYDNAEMKKTKDELNTSEDGQIITFGSPQLGIHEMLEIASLMEGRKFTKPCKVFCPKDAYDKASECGILQALQKSGADFVCDACTCLTPLIKKENYDNIITNSVKASYYMKTANKVSVALKDLKTITKEYSTSI